MSLPLILRRLGAALPALLGLSRWALSLLQGKKGAAGAVSSGNGGIPHSFFPSGTWIPLRTGSALRNRGIRRKRRSQRGRIPGFVLREAGGLGRPGAASALALGSTGSVVLCSAGSGGLYAGVLRAAVIMPGLVLALPRTPPISRAPGIASNGAAPLRGASSQGRLSRRDGLFSLWRYAFSKKRKALKIIFLHVFPSLNLILFTFLFHRGRFILYLTRIFLRQQMIRTAKIEIFTIYRQ